MKGSVKLFIASLIVLAASIGFFAGSMCNKPCSQRAAAMEGMMPPPGIDGKKHHHDMKGHDPKGEFRKHPHEKFGKGPSPEVMDSIMQVTPEQKAKLEKHRTVMDSTFKAQRKQKMEAEKALRDALDNGTDKQINVSRQAILNVQQAMLDSRIDGARELSKILSKEQLTKLHDFQKEMFKKHKKGPKGPAHGEMPPQE